MAATAGVPLHSDPPAARALHATVEIGREIAPEHYRAVAAAIRFADRMRRAARDAGAAVTPAALRRLAALAEARRARDLARLDGLLAEDRRLVAEIAALAGTAARDLAEGVALPLAQQGLRQAWADQRDAGGAAAAGRARARGSGRRGPRRCRASASTGRWRSWWRARTGAAAQLRIARAEREAPAPAGKGFDAAG